MADSDSTRIRGVRKRDLVVICEGQQTLKLDKVDLNSLFDYLKEHGDAWVSQGLEGIYPDQNEIITALVSAKFGLYHYIYRVKKVKGQIQAVEMYQPIAHASLGVVHKPKE